MKRGIRAYRPAFTSAFRQCSRAEVEMTMNPDNGDTILYLPEESVRAACAHVDVVAAVCDVLLLHGKVEAVLPDEAYLHRAVEADEWAKSLNLPGYLGGNFRVAGNKIINGNLWNKR